MKSIIRDEYEMEMGNLEKKFETHKEELKDKEGLAERMKKRYEKIKIQYEEVCEEFDQELKGMKEENSVLQKEVELNEKIIQSYFDVETYARIKNSLSFNAQYEFFKLSEQCDTDVRDLCEMYSNIKQIEELHLETDIEETEENILLFYSQNPFVDFKC